MNHRIAVNSAFIAYILAGAAVSAQEQAPTEPPAVTREDRQATREAMRERFENMSDEERAAAIEQMRANRGAMRERFENLSEAEREALRERRESGAPGRPGRRAGRPGRPRGPLPEPSGERQPDA